MPKSRNKSQPKKTVKSVLHIYCEGEKTEPNYINTYIQLNYPTQNLLKVVKVEPTLKNTPIQLVEEAINKKTHPDTPKNDKFWVVYDRESVSKYPDQLHQTAFDKANHEQINIALSNICFEFWILLHFIETSMTGNNCDDVINHSHFKTAMSQIDITNYQKGQCDILQKIIEYHQTKGRNAVDTARNNAKKINNDTERCAPRADLGKPYRLQPYTQMHLLLDAIDEFASS